ncbi:conserved hypothetical protein [Ricinus communis]|uniref:Uncharacterized protein n=1 Tax=Ricinus communis TaxID=3988 RepID=B9SFA9_RICCO|nr:conserved hypothetical protein [Ricinus communis]
MATAKTVKDVSPHQFVKAYVKRSGKYNSIADVGELEVYLSSMDELYFWSHLNIGEPMSRPAFVSIVG